VVSCFAISIVSNKQVVLIHMQQLGVTKNKKKKT